MRLLLALSALAALGAAAPPPSALKPHIGGRVITGRDGAVTFGWPGVYFEGRFRGSGIRVKFDAPADHMRLLVDGEEKLVFKRPGLVDTTLQALPAGEHVVRLEKLTESQSGGSRFLGFFPIGGGVPLPPRPRRRQIEFIGDSYTVGYGNTSATQTCSEAEVHATTDTQQAFGPLVAKRLDADYRINAYSGFGVVRNYNGGRPGLSLPAIYERLKPDDPAHLERNEASWRPQVIVVNLGTNDFSTPLKAGEAWRDQDALKAAYRRTYVEFVRALAARQPQARFILMGSELFFPQVEQVAATLNKDMKGRVTALRFTGLDHAGCHSHPSLADNRRLADLLQGSIGTF
jgi:lysophospholipase L1-like esterase